jgi:hypothetical protein
MTEWHRVLRGWFAGFALTWSLAMASCPLLYTARARPASSPLVWSCDDLNRLLESLRAGGGATAPATQPPPAG